MEDPELCWLDYTHGLQKVTSRAVCGPCAGWLQNSSGLGALVLNAVTPDTPKPSTRVTIICWDWNDGTSRMQVMPTGTPDGPTLEEEERKEEPELITLQAVRIRTQELTPGTSVTPLGDLASFLTHLLSHVFVSNVQLCHLHFFFFKIVFKKTTLHLSPSFQTCILILRDS